jgi:hypothetical protein
MRELLPIEDVLWNRAIEAAAAKCREDAKWFLDKSTGYDSRGFDVYRDRANIASMMAIHVEALKRGSAVTKETP